MTPEPTEAEKAAYNLAHPQFIIQPDLPIPSGPPPDPRLHVPISLFCASCGLALPVFINKEGLLECDSDKCECHVSEYKRGWKACEDHYDFSPEELSGAAALLERKYEGT